MKCKYCKAELESNSSICPKCGKDNLKDELKGFKIAALSMVCIVMLFLLVCMVNYGITGEFLPDWMVVTEEERMEAKMDVVVATMGEHKMTNRQMQLYYWMSAYSFDTVVDLKKPLDEQVYDKETGKTYHTFFLEEAVETWQEVMLLADAARAANYELPEEIIDQLDSLEYDLDQMAYYYGLDSGDALIRLQYGRGCGFDTYYEYCAEYYLGHMYWTEWTENLEVSDQQIEDYFTSNEEALKNDYQLSITKEFGNLVSLRNILIPVEKVEVEGEDGKKTKVEDWDGCKTKAEEVYNLWLNGERTEESFIALVKEHSKDTATNKKEGLLTDMYPGSMREIDVRHILFFPEGADSSNITSMNWPEEAWEAAKSKAELCLETWLNGEKTEESFAELAKKESEDGSAPNGGLYADVVMGQMVKAFEEWCFDTSRKTGDYGIVKTDYGYHVMYYVGGDDAADEWLFDDARQEGDVTIVKTDAGYEIFYISDLEAAWVRFSRYGAQGELAQKELEKICADNPTNVAWNKIVIWSAT